MNLPDPVLRYTLEATPVHDGLRRALIQLSGFLLKRLTSDRAGFRNFEPVEAARSELGRAAEDLGRLRAPALARPHRSHLEGALARLQGAVAAALSAGDSEGDALFQYLEAAEREFAAASRALPGFVAVDLSQACCASHLGLPLQCSAEI